MLFVGTTQNVYEFDACVLAVWPGLKAGLAEAELLRLLASDRASAGELFDALVAVEAIEPVCIAGRPIRVAATRHLRVGPAAILLCFEDSRAASLAEPVLAPLACRSAPPEIDAVVAVGGSGGNFSVSVDGDEAETFDGRTLAPGLKLKLTEAAFELAELMVVHAATLLHGDRAVLLLGDPGAGKSTLSLHAAARGPFGLGGDDIAELLPDGRVRPFRFPATVKDGAVDLLADLYPAVRTAPDFLRQDGVRVRYLDAGAGLPETAEVGWIVALSRKSGATAGRQPISTAEAMRLLLRGAWSEDREIDADGFEAMAHCVGGAQCCRLRYDSLPDALGVLEAMCRGA